MNLEATAAKELTRLQKARIMQMQRIMNQTAIDVARQIRLYKLKYTGDRVTRFWEFNKPLKQSVESIFGDLNKAAKNIVEAGINDGWDLANVKNNMLADAYGKKVSIPGKMTALFRQPNLFALDAFLTRTEQGMNLSRRIWQYSKVAQDQLELYLASGITQGKSAAKLAKDVKVLLNEPNRLFRRVRDAKGNLHLSKAAAQYHPGTGVYRSSYKNAMRLTRTETNMAYHRSDFMRRQQLPFVIGIEVRLSAAHPQEDICDAMAGQYPKGFLFTGWHAQCICNSISILASDAEFRNYLQTGKINESLYIRKLPDNAIKYIGNHRPQIRAMARKPYWFVDNFTKDFGLRKVVRADAPVYAKAAPAAKPIPVAPPIPKKVGFSPAKSLQEAKDYAINELGIKKVRTDLSVDAMNMINKRITELKTQWKNKLAYFGNETRARAYASANGFEMSFNAHYFNNPDKFVKSLKDCVGHGFHPKGCDTIKSVIDHEFGHVITKNDLISHSYLPKTEIRQKLSKIKSRYSRAVNKMWRSGVNATESPIYISEYAKKNLDEFVAESFAMVINNPKPSRYAQEVFDLIKKHYGITK